MANLLEQYGIKEVADVTLYKIDKTDGGETYTPVLFLDTLKVSTIEQTAEQTEARGGKGNSPLIIWDYGKEITVTLEDALFSPASMAIMFGDKDGASSISTITKMERMILPSQITTIEEGVKYYKAGTQGSSMVNVTDTAQLTEGTEVFVEKTISTGVTGNLIQISAETFPGTYKLVGDTYARNRNTGEDEYFQFVIPQAKMSSENTITLEAEGDPSVFSMTMRVLRPANGAMMELIQYNVSKA